MKKYKRRAVIVNLAAGVGLILAYFSRRYDLMAALTFTFGISMFFILEDEP